MLNFGRRGFRLQEQHIQRPWGGKSCTSAPAFFSGNSGPQSEATALLFQLRLHFQGLATLKIPGAPRMSFLHLIYYNWHMLVISMFLRVPAKAGPSHRCWFKLGGLLAED